MTEKNRSLLEEAEEKIGQKKEKLRKDVENARTKYRNITIKKKILIGTLATIVAVWIISNILSLIELRDLGKEGIIQKSRAITMMGEAIRQYQSENWQRGVFDREQLVEDIKGKFIFTIPVFSSILTMEKKAAELDYQFRVPKVEPRNPKNEPTDSERKILKMMKDQNLDEYYFPDSETKTIRYFKAVKLTKDCLICHGDPGQSQTLWGRNDGTDPTGGRMEGWKEGEIHGAFEIIYSMKKYLDSMLKLTVKISLINIIIIIMAVILIRLLVLKALNPLDRMSDSLQEINRGAGDLTSEIPIKTDDEVGRLASLFNTFLGQLRGIINNVRDSADHVAASSTEMTGSSVSLANVAQEQAASIEETSSAMEEIKATIDSVSQNAKNQARKAEDTRSSMEYLAGAIEDINSNAQNASHMAMETHNYAREGEMVLGETVRSMKEIYDSSYKITEIVTIISDISDKINLLSLNASIEAARAGEHGKGFAVVAEEISKLADQTASSSGEIQKHILDSNNKINQGSEHVEKTADSLRKIITNVKETASLMEKIAQLSNDLNSLGARTTTDVKQVSSMADEISIMMEEQSISSNEIIRAINQINDVTQSVASGSEELAAAAEELSSQSEVLKEIVEKFRT